VYLGRDLGPQAFGEGGARDRETHRATDLAEERQVARGNPELLEGHRVLDDDREDRKRWPDADPGDEHPEEQRREVGVGGQVSHEEQADCHERDRGDDHGLVAAGAGDDLA